jgi:hypothetical protein
MTKATQVEPAPRVRDLLEAVDDAIYDWYFDEAAERYRLACEPNLALEPFSLSAATRARLTKRKKLRSGKEEAETFQPKRYGLFLAGVKTKVAPEDNPLLNKVGDRARRKVIRITLRNAMKAVQRKAKNHRKETEANATTDHER